ncbi:MAG: hypothetical protein JWM47_2221 [Acidimicrobiales bacterium]|nr:hypothetical protein [Acidimicrobiales bacterium]
MPFVAALVGLGRHHWFLTGDWASIDLRIRQVGTADTPLVGPYSTHRWAHPGPLLYWLAAPLHRLSGGSPQSMFWTAALVNLAALAVLARVAAKRLGPGFAVAVLLFASLAAHGLGPGRIVDLWNPLLPLFPLLATCALAWSGATGQRRHGTAAVVMAAAVGQAHVGMAPVLAVVGAWAVAWWCLVQRHDERRDAGEDAGEDAGAPTRWRRPLLVAAVVSAVLWIPPLIDQVWGVGNLRRLAAYFVHGTGTSVGLGRGLGLAGRYVRPDGPWMGGREPAAFASVVGSGPLPVFVLAAVLTGLAWLAWRRGDRLTAAGTSQALALLVASGFIAARIEEPVFDYLVKWLIIISAWCWLWVAWGLWSLVRPHVPARALRARVPVAVLGVVLVGLWSVPAALEVPVPAVRDAPAVAALRTRLEARIDRDRVVHIEHRGDDLGQLASGLIYWLWRDGYRVVSTDGALGLKYGPDVAWQPGDPDDGSVYTVAVHNPGSYYDRPRECSLYPGAELIASFHGLSAPERTELRRLTSKRYFVPHSVSRAERDREHDLGMRHLQVEVWRADAACASGG